MNNRRSGMCATRYLGMGAAVLGGAVATSAVVVSIMSETGHLPAVLFGRAHRFSVLLHVHAVPVELGLVMGFAVAALLLSRRDAGDRDGQAALLFILGTAILALSLTLVFLRPSCVATWTVSLCAVGLMAVGAIRDSAPLSATLMKAQLAVRAELSRPGSISRVVALVAAIIVLSHYLSQASAGTWPGETGTRNLQRWFSAQRPVESEALRSERDRKVVIFTDYQCPVCAVTVPQYRAVISGLQSAGYPVVLEVRDFPLSPECNAMVSVARHSAACEAAVAVRLVREVRGSLTDELEAWLYRQKEGLSVSAIAAWLDVAGLTAEVQPNHERLFEQVKRDADLGRTVGVYSTPTVFVDGVKLPLVTAAALERLLVTERSGGV